MTRVAYLGSWHHIQVTADLLKKGIKEFVCIDTQPRSEYDQTSFFPEFYRLQFTKKLLETCKTFGFEHISSTVLDADYIRKIGIASEVIDTEIRKRMNFSTVYKDACPTLLKFRNAKTDQTLHYYISTNILYNMCPTLEEDLRGCSGLIISGYFPHKTILTYLPKDIEFYCYSNTVYRSDEDTVGTVMNVLNKGIFHFIDSTSGQILSTHSSIDEIKRLSKKNTFTFSDMVCMKDNQL
jgi:hypothetical protein